MVASPAGTSMPLGSTITDRFAPEADVASVLLKPEFLERVDQPSDPPLASMGLAAANIVEGGERMHRAIDIETVLGLAHLSESKVRHHHLPVRPRIAG